MHLTCHGIIRLNWSTGTVFWLKLSGTFSHYDEKLFFDYVLSTNIGTGKYIAATDIWPGDIDDLAKLYDDVLVSILDRLVPARQIVRRRRSSDPWFDRECRDAKA